MIDRDLPTSEAMFDELRILYTEALQKCDLNMLPKNLALKDMPTKPLLVHPSKKYLEAKLKIAYYGQETNGWGEIYAGNTDLQLCLDSYVKFVNINAGDGYNSYKGQFWNALRNYQRSFRNLDDSSGFYWNNVIKIGRAGGVGRPLSDVVSWQNPWFALSSKEMEILAPNVSIFFTGPNYDDIIKKIYPDVEFHGVNGYKIRQLAQLKSKNLQSLAFRTYHPGYLYRFDFDGVKDAIFKCVHSHFYQ
jgi:hypothetical protein